MSEGSSRGHQAHPIQLSSSELIELRAAQRTFEGAYIRTALGQFSFSLVVLKIFTQEFYSIGALFAVFGLMFVIVAAIRRRNGQYQFFREDGRGRFKTSGNVVAMVTAISVAAYSALLVLVLKLD